MDKQWNQKCKTYGTRLIKKDKKEYKNAIKYKQKGSLCTRKWMKETKECYKIKNLIKSTPFKMHNIQNAEVY